MSSAETKKRKWMPTNVRMDFYEMAQRLIEIEASGPDHNVQAMVNTAFEIYLQSLIDRYMRTKKAIRIAEIHKAMLEKMEKEFRAKVGAK